jgi:hypothetical protein
MPGAVGNTPHCGDFSVDKEIVRYFRSLEKAPEVFYAPGHPESRRPWGDLDGPGPAETLTLDGDGEVEIPVTLVDQVRAEL